MRQRGFVSTLLAVAFRIVAQADQVLADLRGGLVGDAAEGFIDGAVAENLCGETFGHASQLERPLVTVKLSGPESMCGDAELAAVEPVAVEQPPSFSEE